MNKVPTANEFLRTFTTNKSEDTPQEYVESALNEFAKLHVINELKNHIEHPTKPGYRRHDILNRIKELESGCDIDK